MIFVDSRPARLTCRSTGRVLLCVRNIALEAIYLTQSNIYCYFVYG